MLGLHDSEFGTFEVEALSFGKDRIQVVLRMLQRLQLHELHFLELWRLGRGPRRLWRRLRTYGSSNRPYKRSGRYRRP